VTRPETQYAKAPDGASIAYQVVGDGPVDLVYATGIWSNLEVMWDHPPWAHFLNRLVKFSRLILFDMRGVGLSDRGPEPPVLELQRDDIGAVMDAARRDPPRPHEGADPLRTRRQDRLDARFPVRKEPGAARGVLRTIRPRGRDGEEPACPGAFGRRG
jgi:pimeloyl-ACP methyl ester carboxylesterase